MTNKCTCHTEQKCTLKANRKKNSPPSLSASNNQLVFIFLSSSNNTDSLPAAAAAELKFDPDSGTKKKVARGHRTEPSPDPERSPPAQGNRCALEGPPATSRHLLVVSENWAKLSKKKKNQQIREIVAPLDFLMFTECLFPR